MRMHILVFWPPLMRILVVCLSIAGSVPFFPWSYLIRLQSTVQHDCGLYMTAVIVQGVSLVSVRPKPDYALASRSYATATITTFMLRTSFLLAAKQASFFPAKTVWLLLLLGTHIRKY